MSSCSSRMSVRSRSSGPENADTSTTKLESGVVVVEKAGGTYVCVTRRSREPLGKRREFVWIGEPEQHLAEGKRRRQPSVEKLAAEAQQEDEDHDAVATDLLIPHRLPQREDVLHHVRSVERGNRNQIERQQQQIDLDGEDHLRLNDRERRLHDGHD